MDRKDPRKKHASSLPTSLHNHLYPAPVLRAATSGESHSDVPESPTDIEPSYREVESPEGSPTQSFRGDQYPPPNVMVVPDTMFQEGSSGPGGGGMAGRGEVGSGSRQRSVTLTAMERSYDPVVEAGRSSERHDYSLPSYPTSLRSSYTRTQQPSLFTGPPAAPIPSPSLYQPEPFAYSAPAAQQAHRDQQQQVWYGREHGHDPVAFQHVERFINPNRPEWRTVTAEEARGEPLGSYDPRSRYAGQQLSYSNQLWPEYQGSTFLEQHSLPQHQQYAAQDNRREIYHLESFRTFPFLLWGSGDVSSSGIVERREPLSEQESRLAGPSSSPRLVYPGPPQPVYSQSREIPPGREPLFTTYLPPFSQERVGVPTPATQTYQALISSPELEEPRQSYGREYSSHGGDPLSLQSLALQPPLHPPTISFPHPEPFTREEDDEGTDRSTGKETAIDHRSETGETSSSLGKRRAGVGHDSEDDDDDDSPRPKKVSKKTQIACNFCRGERAHFSLDRGLARKYDLLER
ncbi:hypothetical protein BXZ70DRAFT_922349 [Cristinia sonorae]|uniref:Uncharacterized protein n=1 Tax=Cristinia sonorae TaxID=1940300 RepID=A0A8K0UVL9_9AGAR|nr:hypothetical protein BXZ70DRAFT_922349 [Cristinia sonorae]